MTRRAVRKHVFEAPITQEDPARGLLHDGYVHWRTNTFVQLGMWVVHAVLMVFVIPLLIHMLVPGESSPEPNAYGATETLFLSFMALFTLIWTPLGTVWTAMNALRLWRQRSWGRLSTLLYAVLSLPTGLGTPAAVYALWSLTRPSVKSSIRR